MFSPLSDLHFLRWSPPSAPPHFTLDYTFPLRYLTKSRHSSQSLHQFCSLPVIFQRCNTFPSHSLLLAPCSKLAILKTHFKSFLSFSSPQDSQHLLHSYLAVEDQYSHFLCQVLFPHLREEELILNVHRYNIWHVSKVFKFSWNVPKGCYTGLQVA